MKRVLALVFVCFCVPAGIAGATTVLPGIRSPSGNIKCLFVPGPPATLLCSLAHADYASSLQAKCMAGPSVDWHGFQLPATKHGAISCSGGILYNPSTQRPHYVTLAYGGVLRHAMFTCWSRTTGVTCQNRANHGLFISRQTWRTW
jgi:hypothetical protein